jgi:hypothetical protein
MHKLLKRIIQHMSIQKGQRTNPKLLTSILKEPKTLLRWTRRNQKSNPTTGDRSKRRNKTKKENSKHANKTAQLEGYPQTQTQKTNHLNKTQVKYRSIHPGVNTDGILKTKPTKERTDK